MTPQDHLSIARHEVSQAIRLAQINANKLFYEQRISPWKDRCIDIWRLEHALYLLNDPGSKDSVSSKS